MTYRDNSFNSKEFIRNYFDKEINKKDQFTIGIPYKNNNKNNNNNKYYANNIIAPNLNWRTNVLRNNKQLIKKMNYMNNNERKKINIIPKFDWETYVCRYEDLQKANINTQPKALNHWNIYGKNEGRICTFTDFDWKFYVKSNEDLKHIKTRFDALLHWFKCGQYEDRTYSPLINKFATQKKSPIIFELYIRELNDDTIDTMEKAITHYNTYGSAEYNKKIQLLNKLGIKNDADIKYFYELKNFIEAYEIYEFANKNDNDILEIIRTNPKIEFKYYCFRYMTYIRNFTIPDLVQNSKKEAVLIEFRKFPHLEFLIRNTIIKLPNDWSHTIVCGTDNYEFMYEMCKKISGKIKIIKYNYDNVNLQQYSELLTSKDFWQKFVGEKILIYQEDSCIFNSNIDDFIEYDYIGAPWVEWPKCPNDNYWRVGNGGLSLRSKQSMIKVIDTISPNDTTYNSFIKEHMEKLNVRFLEDVYFSKNMIDLNLGKVAPLDIAKQFSVENIYYDKPFGGHNFWIICKDWKEYLNKYVCKQFCPPNNLIDILSHITHRGGWKWIICNLIKADMYNTASDINFIDLMEWYIMDDKKNVFNPIFENNNKKYIGLIHGTIMGRFDGDLCCLDTMLSDNSKFIKNIKMFLCVFTFTDYAKNYIEKIFRKKNIELNVEVLRFPENDKLGKFNFENYNKNTSKKLIQIGQQLRYHSTIYKINTKLNKMWLPGFNDKKLAQSWILNEMKGKNVELNDVDIVYLENYYEYDRLLEKNIVLIHVMDANANNAVLECIFKNVPFIINKHPSVVEYLGDKYPLYFNDVNEIEKLLSNDAIQKAHIYLTNMDKSIFDINYFVNDMLTKMMKYVVKIPE